jgi:hypothetical protein
VGLSKPTLPRHPPEVNSEFNGEGLSDFSAKEGPMAEKKTIHRSSESGQFVTKKYADSHKATTETERVNKK